MLQYLSEAVLSLVGLCEVPITEVDAMRQLTGARTRGRSKKRKAATQGEKEKGKDRQGTQTGAGAGAGAGADGPLSVAVLRSLRSLSLGALKSRASRQYGVTAAMIQQNGWGHVGHKSTWVGAICRVEKEGKEERKRKIQQRERGVGEKGVQDDVERKNKTTGAAAAASAPQHQQTRCVQVHVYSLSGDVITLSVPYHGSSVGALKRAIELRTGMVVSKQVLMYHGGEGGEGGAGEEDGEFVGELGSGVSLAALLENAEAKAAEAKAAANSEAEAEVEAEDQLTFYLATNQGYGSQVKVAYVRLQVLQVGAWA